MGAEAGRNWALDLVRVTEAAALAAARWVGKGNGRAADEAASEGMRKAVARVPMSGKIVLGEGEPGQYPLLFKGDTLGQGGADALKCTLALDPLEGTHLCATGGPAALSVIAMIPEGEGSFFPMPETYMNKIAVGPRARGAVDINLSPRQNLQRVAEALGVFVEDLTVVVLGRPRNEATVNSIREAGSRIILVTDGDMAAAVATSIPGSGVDVLMGIGGAPEGVVAAAAIRCLGGEFQGKCEPRNGEEANALRAAGLNAPDAVLKTDDLVEGNVSFAATGVTRGYFLDGVEYIPGGAKTHSVAMRSMTNTVRYLTAVHSFDRHPQY